jgi:lipoate-protein ligase A
MKRACDKILYLPGQRDVEKDPKNGSTPPSTDHNHPSKPTGKGKRKTGGQVGHQGTTRVQTNDPDGMADVFPDKDKYEKDKALEIN